MKKYTYLEIGNRLKDLRKNLSQKDFAKKVGVPIATYQRYEYGERMPPEPVLRRIAELYGKTVDWLLGRDHSPKQETPYTRREHELMDMLVAVLRDENEDNKKILIDIIKTFHKTTKKKTPEDPEEYGGHGMVGDHPRLDQSPKLGGNSYLEDVG